MHAEFPATWAKEYQGNWSDEEEHEHRRMKEGRKLSSSEEYARFAPDYAVLEARMMEQIRLAKKDDLDNYTPRRLAVNRPLPMTYRAPDVIEAPAVDEKLTPLQALLTKPTRLGDPVRLGVSYCAECGRIGGGCRPVTRDVPEAEIVKKWPGDEHEFVVGEEA